MAMLGVIHRSVLGLGPLQFSEFFVRNTSAGNPEGRENLRRHRRQLRTYRDGKYLNLVKQSVLGLIDIYNLLPEALVLIEELHKFQRGLQDLMREEASRGIGMWRNLLSPRNEIWNNRLHQYRCQCPMGGADVTDGLATTGAVNACMTGWFTFKDRMSND